MEIKLKYLGTAGGVLLAVSGFLPWMAKNGISVNGFRPDLGMGIGYWLLGLGAAVALLSLAPGRITPKAATACAGLALLLAANVCWQGYKLAALGWGAGATTILAAALVVLLLIRMVREREAGG